MFKARGIKFPPLKIHGGKRYLAEWIISLMPPHEHYLEPCFGGGWVLLRKDPTNVSEVVCDIDGGLSNFWEVLREPALFTEFSRRAEATPFSELAFDHANNVYLLHRIFEPKGGAPRLDKIGYAWAFFALARLSMSGRRDCFAPITTGRLRRGMNEQASAWLSAVAGLPEVHRRLQRVVILKPQKAQELVKKYDKPNLLMYLDPPYHPETRESDEVYEHEMTAADHAELLDALLSLRQAKVMISGYRHLLYDAKLAGWKRHERSIDNKASKSRTKPQKLECLWTNW